MTRTS